MPWIDVTPTTAATGLLAERYAQYAEPGGGVDNSIAIHTAPDTDTNSPSHPQS